MDISVVICSYNPRMDYIKKTLQSISTQCRLDGIDWELIIVDNGSVRPIYNQSVDLSWHKSAQIVSEPQLGLSFARLKGFHVSKGNVIICVDDDNILSCDYLANAFELFNSNSNLGIVGGKSLPSYEVSPPDWFEATGISLACRDLGEKHLSEIWRNSDLQMRSYPAFAPIGAGMAVRRTAYQLYVNSLTRDPRRAELGRRGSDLSSGEDNDMVLTILEAGWEIAYSPRLSLQHLIPETRLKPEYLKRYARNSTRTWVKVLHLHGINPWTAIKPWTLPFRVARAYTRIKPWKSDVLSIKFQSAIGQFEGRASIGS